MSKVASTNEAPTDRSELGAILGAKGWLPDAGDTITGKVARISMSDNSTSEYPAYPIVTVKRDDNGEYVAVHAFHTLLRDGLRKLRPGIGAPLMITYVGKVAGKNDRDYHNYVVVDPTVPVDTTINWDDVPTF